MSVVLISLLVALVACQDCPANTCNTGETCCTTTAVGDTPQQFGCCPYEKAACCSDLQHCCPNGWNCDVTKGQCIQSNKRVTFSMVKLQSPQAECPAGTCPTSETCCSLTGGQWGCCPYAKADCCTDHAHCCPSGYQCDVAKGQCIKGASASAVAGPTIVLLAKVVAPQADCPAGTCPTSETCCSLTGGQWGCCPYAKADCCTDHAHCCPNGYQCDVAKGQCIKGASAISVASSPVLPLVKVTAPQAECPAGTCPTSETCCSLTGGQWGCCPYAKADCCTDHAHCCPNGYQCDVAKGQCIKGASASAVAGPLSISLVKVTAPQAECPAGTCPTSETCCSLTGGQWGCCPYAKADCCTDHAHCCPSGYQCDVAKGQCIKGVSASAIAGPLALPLMAVVAPQADCPAGTCPTSETCCSLTGGQWGCCPYAKADCCTDHAHCCPNGYQCNVAKGQCIKGASASAVAGPLTVSLAKVVAPQADCPAGTCPTSETCCSLTGGQWGCCPYAKADCCTDHAHCCPSGYQCDVAKGQCIKGASAISVATSPVLPLVKVAAPQADCPAGTCPTSETCCSLTGGMWGCCPYAKADCCTDHAHCCPNGYQCDVAKGQCIKGASDIVLPLTKL